MERAAEARYGSYAPSAANKAVLWRESSSSSVVGGSVGPGREWSPRSRRLQCEPEASTQSELAIGTIPAVFDPVLGRDARGTAAECRATWRMKHAAGIANESRRPL